MKPPYSASAWIIAIIVLTLGGAGLLLLWLMVGH